MDISDSTVTNQFKGYTLLEAGIGTDFINKKGKTLLQLAYQVTIWQMRPTSPI
ncbi:MAG: hypothetical protein H7329_15020 [Opitutaceae bacterium]|nr:hypothetical protein [Cytophagales bacterium]